MSSRLRTGLAVGAIALVFLALFVIRTSPPSPDETHVPQAPGPGPARTFDLAIRDGRLASGPESLTVTEGERITIRVVSDVREEFHLHGYDRKIELTAGVPGELTLVADRSGRFPYELELSGKQIGVLEVRPR
jgi:hypothetical protein